MCISKCSTAFLTVGHMCAFLTVGHMCATGWRKFIGCLILIRHSLQKSPIFGGFFADNKVQVKASYESVLRVTHMIE